MGHPSSFNSSQFPVFSSQSWLICGVCSLHCCAALRLTETEVRERIQTVLEESHAAAVKHNVITREKTIGTMKRYFQLRTVMTAKQTAKAHTARRIDDKVSAERLPSCQASIDAKRYKTPTENPAATKRSQYVRLDPCTSKCIERIEVSSASTPHEGSDWRKPSECPTAKSSRRTAAIR